MAHQEEEGNTVQITRGFRRCGWIIVAALVVVSLPVDVSAQATRQDIRRYCVKGTASDTPWFWEVVRFPSGLPTANNAGPVAAGQPAAALAAEFVSSINATVGLRAALLDGGSADVAVNLCGDGWEAAFSVDNTLNDDGFTLAVGAVAGPADCNADSSASLSSGFSTGGNCNFNAVLTGAGPQPVPGFDLRGVGVLAALVLLGATALLVRRMRSPGDRPA